MLLVLEGLVLLMKIVIGWKKNVNFFFWLRDGGWNINLIISFWERLKLRFIYKNRSTAVSISAYKAEFLMHMDRLVGSP